MAKFQKGDKNNPAVRGTSGRRAGQGRKKGTPNRSTVALREFMQSLTDDNQAAASSALKRLFAGGKSSSGRNAEALRLFASFAEFVIPKLQRTEVTGEGGAPLAPPAFSVTFPSGFPGVAGEPAEDDATGQPPADG